MDATTANHPVILFDGPCNLCNGSVGFISRRDPGGIFFFAALESEAGMGLSLRYGVGGVETVVLIVDGRCYVESDAVLQIVRRLRAPWPILYALCLVPRRLRDGVYRFVARRRDRWFGRAEVCPTPTLELARRFLPGGVSTRA